MYNIALFYEVDVMILKRQSTVTVEMKTDEVRNSNLKVVTSISFKSSNGLFYKITNHPRSNSKTNLYLSFNGQVIINGQINLSAYRADSFVECKDHLLLKLSNEEITAFFKRHENDILGTMFVNTGFNAGASCIWINGKINDITEETQLGLVMEEISQKHRSMNVMEKFLHSNSTVKKTSTLTNMSGNLSLFKLMNTDVDYSLYSTYDNETQIGVFKYKQKPEIVVEGLTSSKYKALLNDHLGRWAINNPKGKFEKIVNDYGFNDDMSYNQIKKMLKMITI
jgi:hypothetical protein